MIWTVSLLPVALYLLYLRGMDAFRLTRRSMLALCLGWGALSAVACMLSFGSGEHAAWTVPLVEEIVKSLCVMTLIWLGRVEFVAEGAIYGAAAGGGFALAENIAYMVLTDSIGIGEAIVRGFGTAVMHMGCTAMMAVLSVIVLPRKMLAPVCLIPGTLIHILYNSLNIPVFHLLCLTVIVFLAFFMLILEWNSRRIYSWMDHTIGSDTALLAAMRRGEFFTTEEGRYLMSVRRQFGNEVFFDMCCYVRLTLETQIAAKSRLLLNSAGLQAPEEDKLRFREASQEIQALRQSIGKTGVYVLKPVLGPPSACDTALRTLLS